MNGLNIKELSNRARRMFTDLLQTIEVGSALTKETEEDEKKFIIVLEEEDKITGEKLIYKIINPNLLNSGITFSELHRILNVSSRTLAKYLKICEKNDLIAGYRCGKAVKYYITEKGERFLHKLLNYRDGDDEESYTFSLGTLAALALSYPKARFVKSTQPRLIINKIEIPLNLFSKFDLERMPEGRIYRIFLKLIHGLGYEHFTRKELEAMDIKISSRLSTPVIRYQDLEKLELLKRERGIRERPIHKIIHLIQWADLVSGNIDKYYKFVRDKEYVETEIRPNKIVLFLFDDGEVTHVIA